MALSRVHTWNPGDVLTAADLNAEFNNILQNTNAALIFPVNTALGINGAVNSAKNVTIYDILGSGANPQLRLTAGTQTTYADLRCDVGGGGDMFVNMTGSTFWLQSTTNPFPTVVNVIPKGAVTNTPAAFQLFSTDYSADATNYERIIIRSKGSGDNAHVFASEKGGTGTLRSVQFTAGSNHIWLDAPTGAVCIGTTTATGAGVGDVVLPGGVRIITGSGSPAGVVSAPTGTLYLRTDGSPGATLYVKESGSGNTGWTAK